MLEKGKVGPGLWRFHPSPLKDQDYVKMIKDLLQEEEQNTNGLGYMSHWEWIKFSVKTRTIKFEKNRRLERDQFEKSLKEEYEKAKLDADQGILDD